LSWRWVAAADVGHLPDHEMTEAEHGGTAALAQHSHLFRGRTGRDSDARVARAEGGSRRPRSWAIPAGSPGTLGVVPLPRWRGCHGCRYRGGRCGGGGDGGRPDGCLARVRATSRLVFLGSLGEPGAPKEDGPH